MRRADRKSDFGKFASAGPLMAPNRGSSYARWDVGNKGASPVS